MSPPSRRIGLAVVVTAIALGVWGLLDTAVVPALLALRAARVPSPGGVAASRVAAQSATATTRARPAKSGVPARPANLPALSRTIHHPLPPAGTPLVAIRADLEKLVAQGDAGAACRLAFELDRCRKLPGMRSSPAFWQQQAAKTNDPKQAESLRRMQEVVQGRLAAAEQACKDFPPEEDTLLAWDYGLASALAGNRMALWHTTFFPWGLDVQHPENTLEQWSQWRELVPQLLQAGVEGGDPRLFSLAARAYLVPYFGMQVYPRDPVRSVAYLMAIAPQAAEVYRATMQRDLQFAIERGHLDAQQVEAARAIAQTLPPLKDVPPGGFDRSRGMSPDEDGSECEQP
jgi:hypothetical protein